MKRRSHLLMILSAAVVVAGMWGCEVDDSTPTRPRTANPLAPDTNAQNNAEKRELERPTREMPTSGAEFPGQSKADFPENVDPNARVLTLQAGGGGGAGGGGTGGASGAPGTPAGGASGAGTAPAAPATPAVGGNETAVTPSGGAPAGVYAAPNETAALNTTAAPNNSPLNFLGFSGPSGFNAFGHTIGPTNDTYTHADFPGPLPLLPANPGIDPMPGSSLTPDGDWIIDDSWGQGLVLENYPHRPWPVTTIYYQSGAIYNNPTYFFHIQDHLPVSPTTGTYSGDIKSDFYEIPWFMVNTAALPVLMALEPPLAKRMTARPMGDPNFLGHVPTAGPTVPVPAPGALRWDYSFLNPDWTVKEPGSSPATEESPEDSATQPAAQPATAPAAMPGG